MLRKGLLPTHLAQLGPMPCQRQCSGLGGCFLGRGVLNPTLLLFSCSVMSNSATPGTVARQASLPMGIPRQEYRSGLPFPSQEIFLTQGSNLHLLYWQADSLPLNHQGSSIGAF